MTPGKLLVKFILENALKFEWSLQGFGMLRLYLPNDRRLNVWDNRYRADNVSDIHTHPWDLKSVVIAGELTNHLYLSQIRATPFNELYLWSLMTPGPDGGLTTTHPQGVYLYQYLEENIIEGGQYQQRADEIHRTEYVNGTVTLNHRHRGDRPDTAKTFWPVGTDWIDAKPRKATAAEVMDITRCSLTRHFNWEGK